jgi:hypothetical protein
MICYVSGCLFGCAGTRLIRTFHLQDQILEDVKLGPFRQDLNATRVSNLAQKALDGLTAKKQRICIIGSQN